MIVLCNNFYLGNIFGCSFYKRIILSEHVLCGTEVYEYVTQLLASHTKLLIVDQWNRLPAKEVS